MIPIPDEDDKEKVRDPVRTTMNGSRVLFECSNCQSELAVSNDDTGHSVTMGSFGVTISPGWSCPECGLEGRIKNSEIIVTGRKRIPPSAALDARSNPKERVAIKIESKKRAPPMTHEPEEEYANNPNPDPEDCPNRRKHGYYGRVKETCPICGGKWHDEETLTEEKIQQLSAEAEQEESEETDDGA